MQSKEEAFRRLEGSKFRLGFHLSSEDKKYIEENGMDVIRQHAEEFIRKRLAPAVIPNDGKQTPWKGHPVFRAAACMCMLLQRVPGKMV